MMNYLQTDISYYIVIQYVILYNDLCLRNDTLLLLDIKDEYYLLGT